MNTLWFPWWLREQSVCLQCRRPGFNPWVGKSPLEKEKATHSSILAWGIPWTEEPGRLPSTGSQRVGHHWVTSLTHSVGVNWNLTVVFICIIIMAKCWVLLFLFICYPYIFFSTLYKYNWESCNILQVSDFRIWYMYALWKSFSPIK